MVDRIINSSNFKEDTFGKDDVLGAGASMGNFLSSNPLQYRNIFDNSFNMAIPS
jgi:hypothetical protein